MATPDIYDSEIARLKDKTPLQLFYSWAAWASPLFDSISINKSTQYACASQLSGSYNTEYHSVALEVTPELKQLLSDMQFPDFSVLKSMDPCWLPKFAEAQRLADAMIPGRKPPLRSNLVWYC